MNCITVRRTIVIGNGFDLEKRFIASKTIEIPFIVEGMQIINKSSSKNISFNFTLRAEFLSYAIEAKQLIYFTSFDVYTSNLLTFELFESKFKEVMENYVNDGWEISQ